MSRCDPNFDIGLMPMALFSRIFAPKRRCRNSITASASELPAFAPPDAALPARRPGHRGVEDLRRRPPDVGSGAVAFDEGDDGMVGDDPVAIPVVYFGADGAAAAAFHLCWHGPQFTTKRPAF